MFDEREYRRKTNPLSLKERGVIVGKLRKVHSAALQALLIRQVGVTEKEAIDIADKSWEVLIQETGPDPRLPWLPISHVTQRAIALAMEGAPALH